MNVKQRIKKIFQFRPAVKNFLLILYGKTIKKKARLFCNLNTCLKVQFKNNSLKNNAIK